MGRRRRWIFMSRKSIKKGFLVANAEPVEHAVIVYVFRWLSVHVLLHLQIL